MFHTCSEIELPLPLPETVFLTAHCLYIALTDDRGGGLFTSEDITKGSVIEIAPVLVMSALARTLLDKTLLHDYIFE